MTRTTITVWIRLAYVAASFLPQDKLLISHGSRHLIQTYNCSRTRRTGSYHSQMLRLEYTREIRYQYKYSKLELAHLHFCQKPFGSTGTRVDMRLTIYYIYISHPVQLVVSQALARIVLRCGDSAGLRKRG